jgi:hypothetical protein
MYRFRLRRGLQVNTVHCHDERHDGAEISDKPVQAKVYHCRPPLVFTGIVFSNIPNGTQPFRP